MIAFDYQLLGTLATIFVLTSIVPISAFIYYYGTEPAPGKWYRRRYSNRWRSTEIGKVLMYQKVAWLATCVFISVNLLAPADYAGKEIVRFVVYGSLVFLFWRVFIVLRQIQRVADPNEKQHLNAKHPDEKDLSL